MTNSYTKRFLVILCFCLGLFNSEKLYAIHEAPPCYADHCYKIWINCPSLCDGNALEICFDDEGKIISPVDATPFDGLVTEDIIPLDDPDFEEITTNQTVYIGRLPDNDGDGLRDFQLTLRFFSCKDTANTNVSSPCFRIRNAGDLKSSLVDRRREDGPVGAPKNFTCSVTGFLVELLE